MAIPLATGNKYTGRQRARGVKGMVIGTGKEGRVRVLRNDCAIEESKEQPCEATGTELGAPGGKERQELRKEDKLWRKTWNQPEAAVPGNLPRSGRHDATAGVILGFSIVTVENNQTDV